MRQILSFAITVAVWWFAQSFMILDWLGPLAIEDAETRFYSLLFLGFMAAAVLMWMEL